MPSRAGTTTRYYWGDDAAAGDANCDGCGGEWTREQTAPVGTFKPNAFGLHDMVGNVWEWVEDPLARDLRGCANRRLCMASG